MIMPTKLTKKELTAGFIYLALSFFLLPIALGFLPVGEGKLNFIYYCVNFLAVILIFRRFLTDSVKIALERPFATLYYGALAYLGYEATGRIFSVVILTYFPEFFNVNDQSVLAMMESDLHLMIVGTVLLVPIAEECFYRGLFFRSLYDRCPVLAYIVSMVTFSALHVVGYIGYYEPLHLLLCFLQYLPAAYCLCFAYRRSGTIVSPILVHTLVNTMSISYAMR